MAPSGWVWDRGARRVLSSGVSPHSWFSSSSGVPPVSGVSPGPGSPRPFEEMPRSGRNRWVNLLRLWSRGGFQDFHRRMEGGFRRLGPVYR